MCNSRPHTVQGVATQLSQAARSMLNHQLDRDNSHTRSHIIRIERMFEDFLSSFPEVKEAPARRPAGPTVCRRPVNHVDGGSIHEVILTSLLSLCALCS